MNEVRLFFQENQNLFYFALSVIALFAGEAGRRGYKRRNAKALEKQQCPVVNEQPKKE